MVSAMVPSQSKTRPLTVESMGSFMGGGMVSSRGRGCNASTCECPVCSRCHEHAHARSIDVGAEDALPRGRGPGTRAPEMAPEKMRAARCLSPRLACAGIVLIVLRRYVLIFHAGALGDFV